MSPLPNTVEPDATTGLYRGQAAWMGWEGHRPVGIAWDWAEVAEGVITVVDPMRVVSNARVVEETEEQLEARRRALSLNAALFSLPWRSTVLDMLARKRALLN